MKSATRAARLIAGALLLFGVGNATAQDWPQWRGPNRDAKATGFKAPATWPAALTKKWDVTVGDGVANPSLVGDRLYVIAREGENEVVRCLNTATGGEVWQKSYPAAPAASPADSFPGPRATPTVADGKVLTLGVQGLLVCWNAADGKQLWQKDEFVGASPTFFTSSSPIVVDGKCIAQLGGKTDGPGAMLAFDMATGEEKWRANEGSGSYGSPVLMSVDGMQVVIGPSETKLVAVNAADGKVVWQIPYRQGNYNAATPIVDGQTLIFAGPGRGLTAVKFSKQGDELKEEEVWKYADNSLIYNTPVHKDGNLFGLSTMSQLFCVKLEDGKATTAWTAPIARPAGDAFFAPGRQTVFAQQEGERGRGEAGAGRGQGGDERRGGQPGRGRGRGRRGRGGGGYGSVVDAGAVLLALSPAAELVVFKPSQEAFTEVTRYKVSDDGATYAYPIASGNRIFIKDRDSVALWTVD
ncbi:MAG: PQQ-binding-like beta-propeller repeat protein [Pirellulales bacterium]